ncbi:MAG: DUF2520 domain-containing protein [Myxococcaceae bacterium]
MKCQIYALGRAGKALALSLSKIEEQPDVLFLTVPDQAIIEVAEKLAQQPVLPKIITHLSGANSYQILDILKNKTAIAQFHPLVALTGDKPIPEGVLCAISSNQPWAFEILAQLARSMNLKPIAIDPDKTVQYHAAAVITGNLSLGLVQQSITLMQEAGIDAQTGRIALSKLLKSVAENLESKNISEALTGPIARKDLKTIQSHLEILSPEVKNTYLALVEFLLI